MAEFSWAYIDTDAVVAVDGPTGSVQYRVADSGGHTVMSGTQNFVFHTASNLLAITGSVEISGTLTANQYNINVIDKTVTNLSASGDTIFGDTADDTHQFTGSVYVNGNLSASANISGSAFYGDGSNITNLTIPVQNKISGSRGQFNTTIGLLITSGNVHLGDAGSDVTTVNSQLTASQGITANGNANFNGNTTLGNAAADVVTVIGQLTASQGALFNQQVLIVDDKNLVFGTNGDAVIKYDEAGTDKLIVSGSHGGLNILGGGVVINSPLTKVIGEMQLTGSINVTGTVGNKSTFINTTHVSSSLNISGSAFYGDGSELTNLSAHGGTGYVQLASSGGTFTSSPNLVNITGLSADAVTLKGSITVTGSVGNKGTVLNATHVSSSLNISGSSFYGDGSTLTGVVKAAAGSSGQIQYNNGGAFGAAASLAVAVGGGGVASLVVTGSTTTKGSVQVLSGSTQVFGIDSSITGLGGIRGRMVQHIRSAVSITSGADALAGRYVSIGGNAATVSATPANTNCMITPFAGRLISIMYHMPSPAGKQLQAKGPPQWELRVGDVNALKGNTFAASLATVGQVTASSWPGNNVVGGLDVQTKVGSLGGTNVTGNFSFGTGSVVGLFFKSGGSDNNNYPGAATFTTVWEFDELNPYITGSGN
mgnify:FL=1